MSDESIIGTELKFVLYDVKVTPAVMNRIVERDAELTWHSEYKESFCGSIDEIEGVDSTDYDATENKVYISLDSDCDTDDTWIAIRKTMKKFVA